MDKLVTIDVYKGIKRVVKTWDGRFGRHGWLKPEPAPVIPY